MSETAQNYRRKAALCWKAAACAKNPDAKQQFKELTEAWLRLAERSEHEPDWQVHFINDKKTGTE